ncbi:hypothetical protein [Williamsia serinedens]|uniref:hypothetical protein n=1 Tax=Williamsia serinedens TaxID=391736 RepID=UPI0020A45335|nr:hypothetical protein [Williamsia serinedens]
MSEVQWCRTPVAAKLRVVTSAVVTDLGPVLTAHTGRGAVGVVVCPGLDPIEGYTPS